MKNRVKGFFDARPNMLHQQMNTVFFDVGDKMYCLLQDPKFETFALVDVLPNTIIVEGPRSDLAQAVAALLPA